MIPKSSLVTAPSAPVVDLAEGKKFLRIDQTDDDSLIDAIITAATSRVESIIDRKLITQTWDIFFDSFPVEAVNRNDPWWDGIRDGAMSELYTSRRFLDLPFGPLISVTHLKTYDDADTAFTFASSGYSIDTKGPFGRIALKAGSVWPATILRPVNGIEVRGVFGYGAGAVNVPTAIKQAILNLVAIMYEHRGDELPKIPAAVSMLLEPYRRIKVGG